MKLVDSLIASLFELQINLLHARLRLEANTDDEALHEAVEHARRLRRRRGAGAAGATAHRAARGSG